MGGVGDLRRAPHDATPPGLELEAEQLREADRA
jgi:hypothetical protein